MGWSLYEGDKYLPPLTFSNGKSQEEIVEDICKDITSGEKIIFVRGMCGTGKSAIALNIAKKIGKTSIVVPGKSLQGQYKTDYEDKKTILKEDKKPLKISVITGRKNHKCKFTEDNSIFPKREINLDLDSFKAKAVFDESADKYDLPCKIDIREKNIIKLKEYLKQNKHVNPKNVRKASEIKRVMVAGSCPYWSPCLPEKYDLSKLVGEHKKRDYMGLEGNRFIFYQRKEGCSFYNQFNAYIDSDVIVFNSQKYKLETAINRKPLTEVEIIDECDEFLDSFSNQATINIDRLQNSLNYLYHEDISVSNALRDLNNLLNDLREEYSHINPESGKINNLRDSNLYEIFNLILKNYYSFLDLDEESYLFEIMENIKIFEKFLEETFFIFNKTDNSLNVSVITTNLAKKFKEMVDKNKSFVLMSGTLHSEEVLKEIFGLDNFKIIDAETINPGTIEVKKTGKEFDCKYSNFSMGKHTRKEYLENLNECVKISKRPTLIQVNAFTDLPTEFEKNQYNLNFLVTDKELREQQDEDKEGIEIELFKKGEKDLIFSTRCTRGIDFPGEQCNSIVFTKYPNPNIKDLFWRILNETNRESYWKFYRDKAKRELLQRVYRGLRFKGDHVYILSPDLRVLEEFN